MKTRTNDRTAPAVGDDSPPMAEPDRHEGALVVASSASRVRERSRSSAGWSHLVPLGSPGPDDPIFCVHGFDGITSRYRPMSASIDRFHLVGLQAAGVDGLRPMHRTLDEMAGAYVDEMVSYGVGRPFVVLGHAEGGVLAWEITQRLAQRGEQISALVLVDAANPARGARERFLRSHLDAFRQRPIAHPVDVASAAARARRLARSMDSPQAFSAEPVDAGVRSPVPLDIRMHRLKANTQTLLRDYEPQPLGSRVLFFESATPAGSRSQRSLADDWRGVATNLDVVPLSGAATTALADPYAARLGRLLSSWLMQ